MGGWGGLSRMGGSLEVRPMCAAHVCPPGQRSSALQGQLLPGPGGVCGGVTSLLPPALFCRGWDRGTGCWVLV